MASSRVLGEETARAATTGPAGQGQDGEGRR